MYTIHTRYEYYVRVYISMYAKYYYYNDLAEHL